MEKPTLSITIPKPCHEDWNKFTPDEKGAFCGSCKKSVYDFTNKTDEEIAQVFAETKGAKICGRFNVSQIDRPIELDIPLYAIQRPASPVRAFAMAAFLIFGTMLFSCQTSDGQVLGQMKVITKAPVKQEENMVKGKPSVSDKIVTPKENITPPVNVMMGGPKATWNVPVENTNTTKTQDVPVEKTLKGDVKVCAPPMKGEVMIREIPPVDTTETVEAPVQDTAVVPEKMPEVIMGKISYNPTLDDEIINIDPVPVIETEDVDTLDIEMLGEVEPLIKVTPVTHVDTILIETAVPDSLSVKTTEVPNDVIIDKKAISLEVMPNPSNGIVTLRYMLKEKNMTQIELYNLQGTKVKTLLLSQSLYEGTYNTAFDISELSNGTYLCKMISGEKSVTSKIILSK